jgi:hypothetical protein
MFNRTLSISFSLARRTWRYAAAAIVTGLAVLMVMNVVPAVGDTGPSLITSVGIPA